MSFIIYEDDKDYAILYKSIINKLMGYSELSYNIVVIDKWSSEVESKLNKIEGNKVYILDVEVEGKNGIDLARMIRNNGDWISPIIVITSHKKFKTVGYASKILMLDFILKKENVEERLLENLKLSLKINDCKEVYSFSLKGIVYNVPFSDILYIEKNLNDNSSFIVTKENRYVVRKSIVNIEKELRKHNFCKAHRSCIVNIDNVKSIDFDNGIIFFDNKEINLLSRSKKKLLKERLGLSNV